MPKTKFERIIFAFLSVVITVTLFVFYNISLERGGMSNSVFKDSLNVFFIEFVFAFFLQIFIAGPLSMKIAFRMVNPKEDKPFIVKNAIICSTIILMCPMMSFVATILYNGITSEFIAQWMEKIVFNFPFAFFSQLFFIQPVVRFLFRTIFRSSTKRPSIV